MCMGRIREIGEVCSQTDRMRDVSGWIHAVRKRGGTFCGGPGSSERVPDILGLCEEVRRSTPDIVGYC